MVRKEMYIQVLWKYVQISYGQKLNGVFRKKSSSEQKQRSIVGVWFEIGSDMRWA